MALKYVNIAELRSGTKVEACYLLQNFQTRPKKDGSNFVTLALKDASGKITGIMWDNFDHLSQGLIKDNDFVTVQAEVLTYNNQLQLRVAKICKVSDSEVDAAHFLPTCSVPLEDLERQLDEMIARIKDSDLRILVQAIFSKPAFRERFRRAPSAVSMHQAYIGGLMEHTICVTLNALRIAENYPAANKSLVVAAALLHDVGKTVEFSFEKKIAYTDVGRLIGHIAIGHAMVELECATMPEFPLAKKVLLQHVMLSHHGLLEYGSPKRPKTLEALIVHHADQLDAHLSNFLEYSANASKSGVRWEFSNMFDRYMFGNGCEVEGCDLMREVTYASHAHSVRDESPAESLRNAVPSDELFPELAEEPDPV